MAFSLLHVTDATVNAQEAFWISLHAIKHSGGIALRVPTHFELACHNQALVSLMFDADTKAQLHFLPLGHEEPRNGSYLKVFFIYSLDSILWIVVVMVCLGI